LVDGLGAFESAPSYSESILSLNISVSRIAEEKEDFGNLLIRIFRGIVFERERFRM